ncbi:unnamed protein product [Mytilus coruscus]|uniref:Endonuclease/exonuclease/phosphatase domain-containing protein n=1 Tax=Mytilus coruscus TaxID=42192 RepID=A0A6J8D7K7_MYTCO|nr:unnamed protein product [Mytilus coruscus]
MVGDFNSQSHSWGYNTIDKKGETIEDWQAFCTDDIHQNIRRKVCDQLGGSDNRLVILSIRGTTTHAHAQLPRWNYKKANWGKFETRANELTKDTVTEGKNINNVVNIFNASRVKAAKESKAATNVFANGYEAENNTNIPTSRKKEVRTEFGERQITPTHEIMQRDITMSEMKQSIRKLKKKKSQGPDDITNEMLQHLGNSSLNTLLDIFNLSWSQGQVPQCWEESIMMPILQKGKNK